MNDPLIIINKVKKSLDEIIKDNDLKYLDGNIDDILNIYSSDLVSILLRYYPGATIMMHKFYRNCAILINGKVYNSYGLVDKLDYHIALEEEINFIQKSFPNMSDTVINSLNEKLTKEEIDLGIAYTLRKNNENYS